MNTQGIFFLGALAVLLVIAGLVVAIMRSDKARRTPLHIALAVALAVSVIGGAAWLRAEQSSTAPVNANLTIFTLGLDCSRVSRDCGLPNALYALRADTGATRWEAVEPKPTYFDGATPLLHDGIVYAFTYPGASATIGPMDNDILTAWRGGDGARLWSARVLIPCCEAPPVYAAGNALAILDTSVADSAGNLTWNLLLLNASDGSRIGITRLPENNPPTVADGVAYQCLPSGGIIATRVSDGALVWRSSAPGAANQLDPICDVTVANGMVFAAATTGSNGGASANGQVIAVSAATGQTLWRYATPTPHPLAVGDGLVVLGEGNRYAPSSIIALRVSDGAVAWRHQGLPSPPMVRGFSPFPAVVAGAGLVLLGGSFTGLLALRADNGNIAWRIDDDSLVFNPIGVDNDTVFVRSRPFGLAGLLSLPFNGSVAALRASDGSPYWQTTLDVQNQGPIPIGSV